MSLLSVLYEVQNERAKQDHKWGPQHHVANERWGLILGEEFGEACEAALMEVDTELRKELIQVAAVAVNWIESIDSRQP